MRIADFALLTRNPEIYSSKRGEGEKTLLLSPQSASWLVLPKEEALAFANLKKPVTAGRFLSENFSREPQKGQALLEKLYLSDLIRISGRSIFNPETLWQLPQTYPGFLCLHMTEACNLVCKYCYAAAHSRKARMPLSTAKKIIERLLSDLPLKNMMIDFHGGEPFLEFDNMIAAAQHGFAVNQTFGKNLRFITQTNGSLITRERAKLLKQFKIAPGISLDGPPEIHNRYRIFPDGKGSFDRVWEGIQILQEEKVDTGLLAVVHQPEDYPAVLNFFLQKGFTGFRINFSSYIGRAKQEMEFHYHRGEEFARWYLKMAEEALSWCRKNDRPLRIQDLDHLLHNLVFKTRPFMCYRSPCGIGNSILGFGIDGAIYGCEEMASAGIFKLGSIFEPTPLNEVVQSNPVLLKLYRRKVENIPRCKICPFRRFHGGGCTSKVYAQYGEILRESPMCRFYQVVLEELIWMIDRNPDLPKYLIFGSRERFEKAKTKACS